MPLRLLLLPLFLSALFLAGCTSYVPPGPKADLGVFAAGDIEKGFSAKPAARFPASLAVVRTQGARYTNFYLQHVGATPREGGNYTVISVREVEEQAQLDRIAALPRLTGVTGINRLLLPDTLKTDEELRAAAARLQAELLLIYTFDTSFFDQDAAKPLSVVTLGLSPTRSITAATTVSALLIDTRTGYVRGAFEVTERAKKLGTSWGTKDSADAARRETERAAFVKLVDEFVVAWPRLSAEPEPAPAP